MNVCPCVQTSKRIVYVNVNNIEASPNPYSLTVSVEKCAGRAQNPSLTHIWSLGFSLVIIVVVSQSIGRVHWNTTTKPYCTIKFNFYCFTIFAPYGKCNANMHTVSVFPFRIQFCFYFYLYGALNILYLYYVVYAMHNLADNMDKCVNDSFFARRRCYNLPFPCMFLFSLSGGVVVFFKQHYFCLECFEPNVVEWRLTHWPLGYSWEKMLWTIFHW